MTQMTQIEPLSLTAVRSVSSVSSVFAFLSRPGRPLPPELSIVLRRLPPERTPASRAMDLALIRYRVIEFAPATARVLQPLVPAMHAVAIVGLVRSESSARRTGLGWHSIYLFRSKRNGSTAWRAGLLQRPRPLCAAIPRPPRSPLPSARGCGCPLRSDPPAPSPAAGRC